MYFENKLRELQVLGESFVVVLFGKFEQLLIGRKSMLVQHRVRTHLWRKIMLCKYGKFRFWTELFEFNCVAPVDRSPHHLELRIDASRFRQEWRLGFVLLDSHLLRSIDGLWRRQTIHLVFLNSHYRKLWVDGYSWNEVWTDYARFQDALSSSRTRSWTFCWKEFCW